MIYLMRHGQTDWNKVYKLQGRTDIPLNEEGRQMAVSAGKRYANTSIDICYSSPLIRAYETAQLFLKDRNIPIIKDDRLMEMCFGKDEGAQEVFKHPEWNIWKFFKDPANYVAEQDAESFEELYSRTKSFIDDIIIPNLDKDILIVGHGALCLAIKNQLENVPLERYWDDFLQNCELYSISKIDL